MKQKLTTCLLLTVFILNVYSQEQKVTVEIDYGGQKSNETCQINWFEGMTVMTALQSCATIESYPVKEYIFVTTINGIKTERTVMAWYYTVNGENPDKLAYLYSINPGDTIRWIYKKDVCSKSETEK